jgi:tetratricopeptide (TPR) repeat protein
MNQVAQISSPTQHGFKFPGALAQPAFISLLLAVITLFVFWPVYRFDFLNYDDHDYVTVNSHVQAGLTKQNIIWAFRESHSANWHPLTWISHMLDVQVFGKGAAGPHAINLLFHVANTLLLFLLLRRLTTSTWRSALVAALFALHTLHVESVAWIAERKDVLSAFFFIFTLLAYTKYVEVKEGSHAQARECSPPHVSRFAFHAAFFYLLALTCFALGLMSKPMLVTLPFVLLLLDYWPLRRLELVHHSTTTPPLQSTDGAEGTALRPSLLALLLEKLPFFLLCAASSIVTLVVQKQGGAVVSLTHSSLSARIGNALVSYVRYLGKTVWPTALATPYPPGRHWPILLIISSALFLILLTFAAWKLRRTHPYILVGWLWFLGTLVPVIGLVQVGEQAMADRYMYLPSIGLFIIFVWGLYGVLRQWPLPQFAFFAFAALLLIPLGLRTRDQLAYWQNSETLFRHAIAVSKKNWVAFYNLGSFLDDKGRFDEAIQQYQKALEIDPGNRDPLNNIGWDLAAKGKYAEAVPYFEQALKAQPGFFEAHYNLGKAYEKLGKIQEANEHYRKVLIAKPDHAAALNNLADAMASRGQFAEAIPFYQASLKAKPEEPVPHYDYANALSRLGRTDDAIDQYRTAVQLKPDYAQARNDLGIALARKGKLDEAIGQLRLAGKYKPQDPSFVCNLGKLLFSAHKLDDAIQAYQQALNLDSDYADAHNALGSALATKGDLDQAIIHFEKALRTRPDNPSTHFNLGKALATKGKPQDAIQHYNEALRLNPNFAPARQELQALSSKSVQ